MTVAVSASMTTRRTLTRGRSIKRTRVMMPNNP